MNDIDQLAQLFKQFPGIGERQARRFAYFVLARDAGYIEQLVTTLRNAKRNTYRCSECFRFFTQSHPDASQKICINCSAQTSSQSLFIVEKDADLERIEKSRAYTGRYFVLGGLITIADDETLRRIRIEQLVSHLKNNSHISEIILGFALSPAGEYTDTYVRQLIQKEFPDRTITLASLGRGLSTGSELEYADSETIKNAFRNRF